MILALVEAAVLMALIRGFTRHQMGTVAAFWIALTVAVATQLLTIMLWNYEVNQAEWIAPLVVSLLLGLLLLYLFRIGPVMAAGIGLIFMVSHFVLSLGAFLKLTAMRTTFP